MCFEREPSFAGARVTPSDPLVPARSTPFLCQIQISWYENFPCLPGRAGHAQFACLRGAQHIVNAPQCSDTSGGEVARLWGVDWSLAGSVVVARALDWTSTEECLRRSWCHEAELPTALVKSKVGFAAFEAGTTGLSIPAQYEMNRRGHRRLARLRPGVDVGSIGYAVMHNYKMDRTRW
jgi:hypothetical protein